MSALLWRVIIAVICVLLAFALIPHLVALFGYADANVIAILRICIAGIAVLYVLKGNPFPPAP